MLIFRINAGLLEAIQMRKKNVHREFQRVEECFIFNCIIYTAANQERVMLSIEAEKKQTRRLNIAMCLVEMIRHQYDRF